MRRWLRVVAALVGFYAGWAWGRRLAKELLQPPPHLIHIAGWGDDEPLPPDLERWMEEEGLMPPPV